MIYGMARDGAFPSLLSKLSTRRSPWIAVLIVMILPCFFVLLGDIRLVAEITNFGTFIVFASVNLSAIWLRYRNSDWERPFKTPITIGKVPLIPLLGLISCGLMVTQFRLDVIVLTIFVVLAGVAVQRILRKV
jgi:APA family basic amino acid/polyamine antiporter